jgi:hypothetical protein
MDLIQVMLDITDIPAMNAMNSEYGTLLRPRELGSVGSRELLL